MRVLKNEAKGGEVRFATVDEVLSAFASVKAHSDPSAFRALIASVMDQSMLILNLPEAGVSYFFLRQAGCFGITGQLDGNGHACAFRVDPTVALELQAESCRH